MADAAEKARRQREILAVIRDQVVASQEALRRALKRRGFPVTQATLSRDLQELKVVRVPGDDGYRYVPAGETSPASAPAGLRGVAALEVTGIDANETCVIVRTMTGRAQGVAVWLDGLKLGDALATVAGDDTIIVVPRSIRKTEQLRDELARLFGLER